MRNVLFSLLAVAVSFASACEPECRHSIAREFANRYTPLIDTVFDNLHNALSENLYNVVPPELVLAVVPNDELQGGIQSSVDDVLEGFVSQFTSDPLEGDIHQVMFGGENPFKGDCNNPKRLDRKKPPVNETWTMEECNAMDYICGNPPSICHFLDLIKDRIVTYLKTELRAHAMAPSGVLFTNLKENTRQTVQFVITYYGAGSLSGDPSVIGYVDDLADTIEHTLSAWLAADIDPLCTTAEQDELCNGWDQDIKIEILKWP